MSFLSIFAKAYAMADAMGKSLYLFLFALSFIVLWVALEKAFLLFKVRKHSEEFLRAFGEQKMVLAEQRSLDLPFDYLYQKVHKMTLQLLEKNRHFAGEEAKGPIFLSKADIETIRLTMEGAVQEVELFVKERLFILSSAITLAPFMGILGTVWGLLLSFAVLGKGSGMGQELLGGLATALATTAVGLLIAVPALISLALLKAACDRFVAKTFFFGEKVVCHVELHYRKVDALR